MEQHTRGLERFDSTFNQLVADTVAVVLIGACRRARTTRVGKHVIRYLVRMAWSVVPNVVLRVGVVCTIALAFVKLACVECFVCRLESLATRKLCAAVWGIPRHDLGRKLERNIWTIGPAIEQRFGRFICCEDLIRVHIQVQVVCNAREAHAVLARGGCTQLWFAILTNNLGVAHLRRAHFFTGVTATHVAVIIAKSRILGVVLMVSARLLLEEVIYGVCVRVVITHIN
jgi:hypothetical protein